MTKENNERLGVLEEKVDNLRTGQLAADKKLELYFTESKQFHAELIGKVEALAAERIEIATLKEKVRTLEKITWIALTAAGGAMINTLFSLITNK